MPGSRSAGSWGMRLLSWLIDFPHPRTFFSLLFWFKERGRERGRNINVREEHWVGFLLFAPGPGIVCTWTGDWTHNPGTHPAWESYPQPLGYGTTLQPTEPQGQGCSPLVGAACPFSRGWLFYTSTSGTFLHLYFIILAIWCFSPDSLFSQTFWNSFTISKPTSKCFHWTGFTEEEMEHCKWVVFRYDGWEMGYNNSPFLLCSKRICQAILQVLYLY